MKCTKCESNSNVDLDLDVCFDCKEFYFFISAWDGDWYPRDERVTCDVLGGFVSESQRDDEAFECISCSKYYLNGDRFIGLDDEYYCGCCYEECYTTCDSCDEVCDNDDSYDIDSSGDRICNSCWHDNYSECEQCDYSAPSEDLHYHDDEYYCDSCYEEVEHSKLKSYNYVPDYNFYKVHQERSLFFGLEIEVSCDPDSVIDAIENKLDERKYYFKEDSSVNGFEVVSHPMTFEQLKKEKLRDKLKLLSDAGAQGYASGKCGLHIHISKDVITPFNAWKMVRFFSKCSTQIVKISQRNEESMNQWCVIRPSQEYQNWNASAVVLKNQTWRNGPYNSERYSAINFQRSNTIEFRIFRGTLGFDRFWASVEFINSLVHFTEVVSYKFMMSSTAMTLWNTYITYVIRTGYHNTLLKFLKSKGLIANKPKLTY